MKLIVVGNRVINLGLVAWAERDDGGRVTLHFAVPQATVVPNVSVAFGSLPPAASDHWQLYLSGAEADEAWKALTAAA